MIQPIHYKYLIELYGIMEIVVIDLNDKDYICQIVSYKNYPILLTCHSHIFSPCHTDVDGFNARRTFYSTIK